MLGGGPFVSRKTAFAEARAVFQGGLSPVLNSCPSCLQAVGRGKGTPGPFPSA